jgi:hypothetical protein
MLLLACSNVPIFSKLSSPNLLGPTAILPLAPTPSSEIHTCGMLFAPCVCAPIRILPIISGSISNAWYPIPTVSPRWWSFIWGELLSPILPFDCAGMKPVCQRIYVSVFKMLVPLWNRPCLAPLKHLNMLLATYLLTLLSLILFS